MFANYKRGELLFTYLLKYQSGDVSILYQNRFVGLGLRGKILKTEKESVKMALDIDGGKPTGEYYYN